MPYLPRGLNRDKKCRPAQTCASRALLSFPASFRWLRQIAFLFLIALASAFSFSARAVTEVTDCTEDALRTAIQGAIGDDGIVVFTEDCSITLSNTIVINTNLWSGTNNIPDSITIDSQDFDVTITAAPGVRLFEIRSTTNVPVTLVSLKLSGGEADQGGAMFIDSNSVVVVTNCAFFGNTATGTNGLDGANGANNGNGTGGNGKNGTVGGPAFGGAIYNLGDLSVFTCRFETNSATGGSGGKGGDGGSGTTNAGNGGNGAAGAAALGGAIYSLTAINVVDTTFAGNSANGGDGGAGGAPGATGLGGLAGNGAAGATGSGGAVYCEDAVTNSGCTFSENVAISGDSAAAGTQSNGSGFNGVGGAASFGGGIYLNGGSVVNCTFYHNSTTGGAGGNGGTGTHNAGSGGNGGNGTGGGLYSIGDIDVTSCTFSNCNAIGGTNGLRGSSGLGGSNGSIGAKRGGDIAHLSGTTFTLMNTILATNSSGGANFGTIVDAGYNMGFDNTITYVSGSGSFRTNNALLGPLMDNGGPTFTMKPLSNSPAIDKIPADADFPDVDQRGVTRPINVKADIGAVEVVLVPVILSQPQSQTQTNGGPVTFSVDAAGDSLTYHWYFNHTNVIGTGPSYSIAHVSATNAGTYNVVINNSYGSVTSADATLTVHGQPGITVQPTNQIVSVGTNATLFVGAAGDQPLVFQWYNGTNMISGAMASNLFFPNVQQTNVGAYSVTITNAFGSVTSVTARVDLKPSVLNTPTNLTPSSGGTIVLTGNVVGSPPLSLQWRKNGTELSGATTSSLSFSSSATNDGIYALVVANAFGSATNTIATVTNTGIPSIDSQPVSQSLSVGSNFVLIVSASGTAPLSYQWQKNGAPLPGATLTSYSVNNAQTNDSGAYRVTVSNSFGVATSAVATVTVAPFAPSITVQPVGQVVPVDGGMSMTVSAIGASPLSYQWRFNSTPISGGVGPSYSISGVQPEDAGSYDVVVANSYGSVRSSKAVLKVFTPASITQPLIASNNLILAFPSQTGFIYTVQYSSNLGSNLWNNLLSTNGTGATITVKDPLTTQAGRFYRIIVQ